jgi:hypothetical protein
MGSIRQKDVPVSASFVSGIVITLAATASCGHGECDAGTWSRLKSVDIGQCKRIVPAKR